MKTKRKYTSYKIIKEVVKEYQKKRSKPMNYEIRYENNCWWEEKFRNVCRLERTMNDNDGDEINVDKIQ